MQGIYEMDIKNNLVSNQLGVKYPHCISDIFTCHRNNNTVFANAYVCRCWSRIIVSKGFLIGIEALIVGFLLSPYGIPMVGVAVIAFLQDINEAIKSI